MMPSSSRSRGSGGVHGSQRVPLAPMSERQQMALVMQLSQNNAPAPSPTPAEERKRTRQQRNERGETPLHVASIRGDHEQVQKLLDQGEHPDVQDFAGWTPLHEACSYGWLQVVMVLVEGGANVNARGLDDDTPLHDAATSGNLKMVKYLVENGADPTLKNAKGKTPADYAAQHIYEYFIECKDSGIRVSSHIGRSRDDSSSGKKGGGNAIGEGVKSSSMDVLASDLEGKEALPSEKVTTESKDEGVVSSGVVSSSVDDIASTSKRGYYEDLDNEEEETSKRKKRKDEDKEPMGKPAPPAQRGNTGRVLQGTKQPGPASKTGGNVMKASSSSSSKGSGGSSKGSQGKQGTPSKGKSSGGSKGSGSQSKDRQKSPVASPKASQSKDDDDDGKAGEHCGPAPKVPPLKIVIPGGASGSGGRSEQEGEGPRGGGKGRGGSNILPYVIPCTSNDGHASDSSDTNSDEKRSGDGKAAQRILRSHRTNDEWEPTPHRRQSRSLTLAHDGDHGSNVGSSKSESRGASVDLHPRKRKIKASKDSHSREPSKSSIEAIESVAHTVQHANPYQMYIHIRKQIDQRQKSLFPVKPKPPKDFNKYLMNRCTYTLQSNVNQEPQIEIPHNLPPQMKEEFIAHEKERHRLRIQHLVEKEKLVLAVEQEILRVHGRAERAVANQSLPFSVCTMLRDKEVYNVIAPEQEEKRNAQRSRCNGRQINSWLQEVDDKWEKIKEGMLRRQHTEAQTLHAVQTMGWEWKLKEVGLCDYKTTPKIDASHVPQIHVSNFDLPA